jgi:hypothetical protein
MDETDIATLKRCYRARRDMDRSYVSMAILNAIKVVIKYILNKEGIAVSEFWKEEEKTDDHP